jgi:hypothetical protein
MTSYLFFGTAAVVVVDHAVGGRFMSCHCFILRLQFENNNQPEFGCVSNFTATQVDYQMTMIIRIQSDHCQTILT